MLDGDNEDHDVGRGRRTNRRRQSLGDDRAGRFSSNDADESDEVLDGARSKLSEGLRLGDQATAGKDFSPRRLFEYLDSDGIGEVRDERFSTSAKKTSQVLPSPVPVGALLPRR